MKQLTNRENEIALQLTLGKTQKEIADCLYVSEHTVRNHLANIFRKTGARCAVDVARQYILSLDEPKHFYKSIGFLVIQLYMVFSIHSYDVRARSKRGRRNYDTEMAIEIEFED